jgi:hypothetical protein
MLAEAYQTNRGPWTLEMEQRYRGYRQLAPDFARVVGPTIPPGVAESEWVTLMRAYDQFDHLRLSRLSKFLWRRQPDGRAGFSILIFRLSAEDLRTALEAPVETW